MLEALKIARHVAIDERDPDTRVHCEPTVPPGEHVGGRIGVEEPLYAEPPHAPAWHLLGERGQIGRRDRPDASRASSAAMKLACFRL